MTAKITNQPKKIYLCLGDDESEEYDFHKCEGVTWCEDDATNVVIPYVLESELIKEQKKVKKLMEEIQEARNLLDNLTSERT